MLAVFLMAQGAASSQIDVTGTWIGENGWSSYFRQVDGKIVGVVSHCGTVLSRVTDIEDARIDGSTFAFKCSAPNQSRVDIATGLIARADKFEGSAADASWLPDEASARAWRDFVRGNKK